jgi:hypothetical protein
MTIDQKTKKAIELRRRDICIVKNKIYKITAIWFDPILTSNGLHNRFRFVLYCEEDKSEIERIYPTDFEFKLDTNSYVEIEN